MSQFYALKSKEKKIPYVLIDVNWARLYFSI